MLYFSKYWDIVSIIRNWNANLVFFVTISYYAHISISGTVGHTGALERQGSIQGRERMIAHSTALESITVEVDSMSVAGIGAGASGVSATNTSQQVIEDELIDDATGRALYLLIKIWQFCESSLL